MAVSQVALADGHGPCLPAHSPHPPCVCVCLCLFFFFFKTESHCVTQAGLELAILLPRPPDTEIGGVAHHTQL